MITELKSIITLASTWVVVVKNDTEVCMYSILLSGFIEVKPALTPLSWFLPFSFSASKVHYLAGESLLYMKCVPAVL